MAAPLLSYSVTPPIEPILPSHHLHVMAEEQIAQLRSATFQILAETGIHCPSPKALKIYAEHGAPVDLNTHVVKLPPELIQQAMVRAPRAYTLGGRSPEFNLRLDGTAMYCTTDGCGIETIDFDTRQRRPSTKQDTAIMARVADYLPNISFYWPMVSAQDHPENAPLHELHASLTNTLKHVQTETVMDARTAQAAVEMAQVISGGSEALRQRPPISSLICTISPLGQDLGGMEAALVFASAGIPVGFMSMANTGSTAPATIAGTLAVADAEIVAALVLVQLAYPGAPVYYSMMPGVMHPRTGAYLGTCWEVDPCYPAGVELAHCWGVPALAAIFGPDASAPGWQSAAEVAASLLMNALCGAEMGSGMGLLESCTLLYPEELVLTADIYQRVRILAAPIDTNWAALALPVIQEIGPRGNYLRHPHTRQNIRRLRFSELTSAPASSGALIDPIELAREKVRWIIDNHHPQPLEAAQTAELERILRIAER